MDSSPYPQIVRHHEHEYQLVRTQPYTRKSDGQATVLLVWQGRCAICSDTFELTTGATPNPANMVRTCQEHRALTGGPTTAEARKRRAAGAHRGRQVARANARQRHVRAAG